MKIRALIVLAVMMATLWVGLSALAQQKQGNRAEAALRKAVAEDTKPVVATTDPVYLIGEEDVLNVSVWKEPEVTRTVPVRPDGKISLPLLNDVQAAGLTPAQLAMLITEKLRKFIAEPQVTVIVTTINSRRVYILGEVNRAGAFPLLPGMNILQALSSAGGFTPFAKQKGIYVLREENGQQLRFPFNYKDVVKGKRPDQNIVLKPGDTIVVP